MGARSPVIASVLEQHADEVSMLFELREHVADARDLTLGTLAEIDSRVDAHLDGLRIAGKEGLQRLAPCSFISYLCRAPVRAVFRGDPAGNDRSWLRN